MPPEPVGGWTLESLRAHLVSLIDERNRQYEQRFLAQEQSVKLAMEAADRAVTKAEAAMEKRFDSINEFRGTLADQQRNLMPRSEVEVIVRAITEKLDQISREMLTSRARGGGVHEGWGYAIGLLGVIAALLIAFLKH